MFHIKNFMIYSIFIFFIFSIYSFTIGYIPNTDAYPKETSKFALGRINIEITDTDIYVISAAIVLYLRIQTPITIEDANKKAILAGINDEAKSKTKQRAAHIPPPAILFVLILITALHKIYLQPMHGIRLPPHISQQQSAHMSVWQLSQHPSE